ncbi:MAG: FG-GAP repeat domain-containing protein [Sandaracinaceae bacterium]
MTGPRRGVLAAALAALALSAGCYRAHGRTGAPAPLDATVADAGASGADAGPDARVVVREGPPPDPSTCVAPSTMRLVVEQRWPEGDVELADSVHVTSAPIVLPATSTHPIRVAFVSHGTLIETASGYLLQEEPRRDGRMEAEYGGILRLWEPSTDRTISWRDDPFLLAPTSSLAAGDLDGDGDLEIVAVGALSGVAVFDEDGRFLFEGEAPPLPPLVGGSPERHLYSVSGAVTLADLEGDGTMEMLFGPCVMEHDGARRFCADPELGRGSQEFLGPLTVSVDLDGDGQREVLFGRSAYTPQGTLFHAYHGNDGFAIARDLVDGWRGLEVVLVTRSTLVTFPNGAADPAHAASLPPIASSDLAGTRLGRTGGPPLAVDVDGDGRIELAVANAGLLLLVDTDGRERWRLPIHDASSMAGATGTTAVSAADLDGDGALELLHQDETDLRIVDARTGEIRARVPNQSRARTEFPVVVDVDGDGHVEVLSVSNNEWRLRDPDDTYIDPSTVHTPPGITVYGDADSEWAPGPTRWLQHGGDDGTGDRWVRTERVERRFPDLVLERVDVVCGSQAALTVHVSNAGLAPSGGYTVRAASQRATGTETVGERHEDRPIEPGEEAIVTLVVPADDRPAWVTVVPDGDECRARNDTLELGPLCAP